eukprot:3305853-Prymnesium_polylepis.1
MSTLTSAHTVEVHSLDIRPWMHPAPRECFPPPADALRSSVAAPPRRQSWCTAGGGGGGRLQAADPAMHGTLRAAAADSACRDGGAAHVRDQSAGAWLLPDTRQPAAVLTRRHEEPRCL